MTLSVEHRPELRFHLFQGTGRFKGRTGESGALVNIFEGLGSVGAVSASSPFGKPGSGRPPGLGDTLPSRRFRCLRTLLGCRRPVFTAVSPFQ